MRHALVNRVLSAKLKNSMNQTTPTNLVSGRLLARNTLLNFFGHTVPLLVGVATIPFIIRGLGAERFGLLSLAWAILAYFTIFDLGIGRATTKFVAEALGKGEEEQIPYVVWTAVTVQAVLGIIGALVLMAITPLLVERILNIPAELIGEAKGTFYLLSLAISVVLISNSFRGVLEAYQRFDLVNTIRVPFDVLIFLSPLIGLFLGLNLPSIMLLILTTRIGTLIGFVALSLVINPYLKKFSGSFSATRNLFSFGVWITMLDIINPIFMYTDRFLIGLLVSMSGVAYYSVPSEMVNRLRVIPASLTKTLFPAFAFMEARDDRERVSMFFAKAIKYTLISVGLITLFLGLFANEVLQIWLGSEFAIRSSTVLQILAFGVFLTCIAYVPYSLLVGIGRPDIPFKLNLIELPLYIGISWMLINQWGIIGAAISWSLRVAVDTFLLFFMAFKVYRFPLNMFKTSGITITFVSLLLLATLSAGLRRFDYGLSLYGDFFLFMALTCLIAWVVWKKVTDDSERVAFRRTLAATYDSLYKTFRFGYFSFLSKPLRLFKIGDRSIGHRIKTYMDGLLFKTKKGGEVIQTTVGFYLFIPEGYKDTLRYLNEYEPEVGRVISELLRPGMTMVDIGAHLGYYTILGRMKVGEIGRVFAFEPDPKYYRCIIQSLQLNRFTEGVEVYQMAVSDRDGSSCFFPDHSGGKGNLYAPVNANQSHSIEVHTVSLDSFFKKLGWPQIDLIKIDVEGAEVAVLKGMHELSRHNKSLCLIVEFAPKRASGVPAHEFFDTVRQLGFNNVCAIESPELCRPEEIIKEAERMGYLNLLCRK